MQSRMRPLWRLLLPHHLRKMCLNATSASYVTKHALQMLYPPNRETFSTSYSDVMVTHYSSTKLHRSLITPVPRTFAKDQEAFTVICVVVRRGEVEDVTALAGLNQRSPLLAIAMTLAVPGCSNSRTTTGEKFVSVDCAQSTADSESPGCHSRIP